MPQCQTRQLNGIQCVLEEGHEPLQTTTKGDVIIMHNFGGLGDYPAKVLSSRPTWDEIWMQQAHIVASRSLCDRDKVGAVIVTPENIPLISSYNNPPRGFRHNELSCVNWCERAKGLRWRWVSIAGVGAAVDLKRADGGWWYKFPSQSDYEWQVATDEDLERLGYKREPVLDPAYADCPSAHAEMNAISRTNFKDRQGGTIYVTSDMCFPCAKVVANSGLSRVVVNHGEPESHRNSDKSYDFLRQCGLEVVLWQTS